MAAEARERGLATVDDIAPTLTTDTNLVTLDEGRIRAKANAILKAENTTRLHEAVRLATDHVDDDSGYGPDGYLNHAMNKDD